MRKIFCILMILVLTGSFSCAAAESDWADANVPLVRMPETIEVVPYDELPPVVSGQHHYLLLCIDQWDKDARPDGAPSPKQSNGVDRKDIYGNTDGIVLVTLDTRAHRVMLTSIIRDALIRKPNSDTDGKEHYGRINYVYNDFGPEALCRVISQHLGVRVEKYILFTFRQIQDIINMDIFGGVDVDLNSEEIAYLHRYRVPPRSVVSVTSGKDVHYTTPPAGTYHLNGHSAVLYMRIRKAGGGGDFMRTQRVRTVLSKLADKCRSISWEDAQAFANSILDHNNKTNMNLQDMMNAAEQAFQLRSCTIEELRIPAKDAVRPINYANMAAQEIHWPSCREAMADYLQNSFLVIDDEDE